VRFFLIVIASLLAACGPAPGPVTSAIPNPAEEPWYTDTLEQLSSLNQEAEDLFRRKNVDQAAAIITKAQPLASRLLSVPRTTLAAMEAVSDLDDLYGRMLLANRHYGWARLFFQKNVARWKNWQPQSDETIRRKKLAESQLAECDRGITGK
jgi:hypothetical protein